MVWVQFKRAFEDGFCRYQAGGKYDIDARKADVYINEYDLSPDGGSMNKPPRPRANPVCVKCDPPDNEPAGKGRSGRRALYRFYDSVAGQRFSYAAGQSYELPVELGDKYVRRGLAELVQQVMDSDRPETAMRPAGRK